MADGRRPCLCVFVKAPVPGRVKSRLARELGAGAALEAYRILVERELEAITQVDFPVELWVSGDPENPLVTDWSRRYALPVRRQPPGDLGQKMHAAIAGCCDAGRPGIVIGSDLPAVDADYVNQAASLLAERDLVLGPAEDGGYALIGSKTPLATLFAGIDWGTGRVCRQTREKIDRLGLSSAELPVTWDVDTLADWRRFIRHQLPVPAGDADALAKARPCALRPV